MARSYNFQNPDIQSRAAARARSATRPTTYRSKRKIIQEVQEEIIKTELLRDGFLRQIAPLLPKITSAMARNAQQRGGVADRRLIFQATGLLDYDVKEEQPSIGAILSQIMRNAKARQECET